MRSRFACAAALAGLLLAGCTTGPSASTGSAGGTPAPRSAAATTTAVQPSATPEPSLAGGLALRSGRPALVDGEAAACIPLCGRGRVAGGMLPTGRYQTEWFFGGYMTLETDGTWKRDEDSDGELSMPVSSDGANVYRVAFFLDPAIVVEDMIQDVDRSTAAYVAWLAQHPELIVSEPIETQIGSVPATAVDVRLGKNAKAHYDDCLPDPCVTFLKVAAFDHSDGVLGDDEYRLYFADVTYSGTPHLLAVKVEGRNRADLAAVLPKVEALLATVVVPAQPAPHALVGDWLGFHSCERIMAIMTSAGMREQGLLNVAESSTLPGVTTVEEIPDPQHPCAGAVEQRHSHFFMADGSFGSRDMHGQQVDDGRWTLIDPETFAINGTVFDFRVHRNELRMEAVDVGTCPPTGWCREAWKLMVAMPGIAWIRTED